MGFPSFIIRFLVFVVRSLDARGIMPKVIHRASPFHTSAFVTDLGSLGIKPIFHHIYDFGTTSIFLAFGKKEHSREIDAAGQVVERKYIGLKVVNDERICDGHYFAGAFKILAPFLKDPRKLETPPARIVEDVL